MAMDLPPYSDRDIDQQDESVRFPALTKDTTPTQIPRRRTELRIPSDLAYSRDSYGNITCNDTRLTDPTLFSAFIQHHGSKPPMLAVRIKASHWEDAATGPDTSSASSRIRGDGSRRHVVDFEFSINLTTEILVRRSDNSPPYFFTYLPSAQTYRGSTLKRTQTVQEEDERVELGLSSGQYAIVKFLESTRPLKQFCFEKMVQGWDVKTLQRQLEEVVRRDGGYGYNSCAMSGQTMVNVDLVETEKFIYVRPATTVSTLYRHPVAFFLRCLLFPIGLLLWILEMTWLGAYWQVLGAKFDLYNPADLDGRGEKGLSLDSFLLIFHDEVARYARERRNGVIEWPGNARSAMTDDYRDDPAWEPRENLVQYEDFNAGPSKQQDELRRHL